MDPYWSLVHPVCIGWYWYILTHGTLMPTGDSDEEEEGTYDSGGRGVRGRRKEEKETMEKEEGGRTKKKQCRKRRKYT